MKRRQSEHEIAPPVSAFCHSVTVVPQCDRMSAGANQFRDGGHKGKLTDKNFDSRFIERKRNARASREIEPKASTVDLKQSPASAAIAQN